MNYKRIISIILCCMVFFSGTLFISMKDAGAISFSPRLTAPAKSNNYYYSDLNIFYKYGYGMPNCTAYAYGRAYELLGSKPSLCPYNAGEWYSYNKTNGFYSYGSTPKLGAIAVWDNYDNNTGHVAVVEKISGNAVTISQSAWGGPEFYTQQVSTTDSHFGFSRMRFLGFIYIGNFSGGVTPPSVKLSPGELWKVTAKDGLNLRTGASTSSSNITLVPYNAYVRIAETKSAGGYTWGYGTYNKHTGWCAVTYATKIGLLGNLDGNGTVDLNDAVKMKKYIANAAKLTSTQKLLADINRDNKIDVADAVIFEKYIANALPNMALAK